MLKLKVSQAERPGKRDAFRLPVPDRLILAGYPAAAAMVTWLAPASEASAPLWIDCTR